MLIGRREGPTPADKGEKAAPVRKGRAITHHLNQSKNLRGGTVRREMDGDSDEGGRVGGVICGWWGGKYKNENPSFRPTFYHPSVTLKKGNIDSRVWDGE